VALRALRLKSAASLLWPQRAQAYSAASAVVSGIAASNTAPGHAFSMVVQAGTRARNQCQGLKNLERHACLSIHDRSGKAHI
jgi:hypothetical protein